MADWKSSGREEVLSFGPFRLLRSRKQLTQEGRVVRLGSRAIELLIVLVDHAGEVVGKNELIAHVWPNTIVEENNLRVHLTALRKSLSAGQPGTRYIVNVAGRGYSFVAPVTRSDAPAAREVVVPSLPGNLPAAISPPIGRSLAVDTVVHMLVGHRLLTVIGPGGIGKSTVALTAAERTTHAYPAGVFFTDLTTVTDPAHIVAALAASIGCSVPADNPMAALLAHLRDARMLLLVDNCEHFIEDVADVASRLLRGAPQLRLLATSREPLQVDGEQVYQITSLESPPEEEMPTAEQAMAYPAVQLFAERATNGSENFAINDANAPLIARICRRLDGMPLAIEIVAARAGLVGIHALELDEEDSELLAAKGRRTASSRHRSLRATLDWSYRHLTETERHVLMRMSLFRGWFTAQAAVAVVSDEQVAAGAALEALMALVGKSLVATDISGQEFRYRLLHVTRLYAAEHLEAAGGKIDAQRRQARFLCEFLQRAGLERAVLSRARWLEVHQSSIEDVRALLGWAFAPGGDAMLGAQLTAAAAAFGFHAALLDEFIHWLETAIAAVEAGPQPDTELIVSLSMALSVLRNRMAAPELADAQIDRMIALTRENAPPQNIVWPMSQRALMMLDFGDYGAATHALGELEAATRQQDDAFAALTADRVGALVCHWAGDHRRARQLAERVLRHPAQTIPLVYSPISQDRKISMRMVLARILWLEGLADQARELAAEAVELATADGPNALCDALGHAACPIAFWRGDVEEAAALSDLLFEQSRRYALTRWHLAANCFQAVLQLDRGRESAVAVASESPVEAAPLPGLQRDLMGTITDRWFDATTAARGEQRLGGWCTPELLRRRAALLATREEGGPLVDAMLQRSLATARDQGAFAWELRTATDLAARWHAAGRVDDALVLLGPIVDRIVEGDGTQDVLQARRVLQQIQG